MPRIKTDLLTAGMVVVKDVKNIDDMLLIPAGCELTDRQISILQAWGVAEIDVQASAATASGDPMSALSPERAAEVTAEIKAIFWQPDDTNPVFAEIFKLLLQRRVRHKV